MATWKDQDWAKRLIKKAESTEDPKQIRPIEEGKEEEIVRNLDKKAREDSVSPGLAVQERREGVVKVSSYEFYDKVGCVLADAKMKKKLAKFKKA